MSRIYPGREYVESIFGEDSSSGANQIALVIGAVIATIVGIRNGHSWKVIEENIVGGISTALPAIMILFSVGSLIGTWMLSGTVPTMIYYGLLLLDPSIFYPASCLLCAITALSIGSSWTSSSSRAWAPARWFRKSASGFLRTDLWSRPRHDTWLWSWPLAPIHGWSCA